MRIRVVSWNVDSRPTGLLDAKIELLRSLEPDIALLQEINRPVYRALLPHPSAHERMHRTSRLFGWGALSTDLARPRGSEFRLGCAVLGAAPGTALLDAHVLDRVCFDVREPVLPGFMWRTVSTRVALSTGELITACSFHGRQGAGPPAAGLRRPFHAGIAQWLAAVRGPVVFGIDAGEPAADAADPLLGAEPCHEIEDALRGDPERRRAAAHDHLWASRDLTVLGVQCLADEATAAGSDHALLVAELELGSG